MLVETEPCSVGAGGEFTIVGPGSVGTGGEFIIAEMNTAILISITSSKSYSFHEFEM